MSEITLFNEDCFVTMGNMEKNNIKVDVILTSPPYNTARAVKTQKAIDTYNNRYDIYIDAKSTEEYANKAKRGEVFGLAKWDEKRKKFKY